MKRQSGIDLIRCLGLLFVVGVHSFLKNGYYYEAQEGALMFAANSFKWLFYGCNGIFLMLTGYLKTVKPWGRGYYKSLVSVLLSYLFVSLISFPIRHFLLGEKLTLWQWAEKFITFGNYSWYVEMYIGLFLISPILNLAMNATSKKGCVALTLSCAALTCLYNLTPANILPDWWSSFYPVTYYMIGACIRRLQPKPSRLLCILGAFGISMLLSVFSLMTAGEFSQGYGGGYITATVTLLFLALYRVPVKKPMAKTLAFLSGGVFEGYILSRLLDVWVYDLAKPWHSPEYYPLIFVTITLPIFFLSLLAGKAVHTLTDMTMKRIYKEVPHEAHT